MIERFSQAKNLIDAAGRILLVTHKYPDGDALGSSLAMKMGLEELGKQTTVYCLPEISPVYKFLPRVQEIKINLLPEYLDADLIIGLDYGSFERTGLSEFRETVNFLTIDHHLLGNHVGLQIIEEYSSVAEMIYHFLNFLEINVSREIATCLLTGIYEDTGGFRHPNTKAETLEIVSRLLNKGAPLQKIAKLTKKTDIENGLRVWDQIFSFLQTDAESGLIFSLIPYEAVITLGLDFKVSLSTVAGMLSSAPEAKLAVLLTEREPGTYEGCLRTQKDRGVNAARIAEVFGGGGHPLAAGFQSAQHPEEIITQIKMALTENNQIISAPMAEIMVE